MKANLIIFDTHRFGDMAICFDESTGMNTLVDKLKFLAETGFVPLIDPNDPIAEASTGIMSPVLCS